MVTTTERQSNQSSVRLLQILECLAVNHGAMRLQDLAKQVSMTQSTVLRYLYTLEKTNYIYQDEETSKYGLTWRICKLSENLKSPLSLRNIASPFVNNLANTMSLGSCLVTNQNDECLYLDCIDIPHSSTLQFIGKQAPLHVTGSGKLLLSQYTEEKLEIYIQTSGLAKLTERTITDPQVLRRELEIIRENDFATDDEECEIGLRCISCPLRDYSGQIVAAVSVFGNLRDMSRARIEAEIYPVLRRATDVISVRLGYSKDPTTAV